MTFADHISDKALSDARLTAHFRLNYEKFCVWPRPNARNSHEY